MVSAKRGARGRGHGREHGCTRKDDAPPFPGPDGRIDATACKASVKSGRKLSEDSTREAYVGGPRRRGQPKPAYSGLLPRRLISATHCRKARPTYAASSSATIGRGRYQRVR
jgi:hypothetical protein